MPNTICLSGPAFSLTGNQYFIDQSVNFQITFDTESGSVAVLAVEWFLDDILLIGQNAFSFASKVTCGSHSIGARLLSSEGWSGIKYLTFKTCKVPSALLFIGPDSVNEGNSANYYVLQTYSDGSNDNLTGQYTFANAAGGSFNNNTFTAVVDDASYSSNVVIITALKNGVPELTKQVTVNNTTVVTLVSLVITGPDTVNEGSSAVYSLTGTYSNGTQQDLSAEYVFSASEGTFTGRTYNAPSNNTSGDSRNATLKASKNGGQPVFKNITINDKTLKAGILVVDLYDNASLNVIGYVDNPEVTGTHVAAYTGHNIVPAGAAPAQAWILASDLNASATTKWRFEFNLNKLVADNPGTTNFIMYIKGRGAVSEVLKGVFSLKSNDSQMTLTGSTGSYVPSVTGGSNITPLKSFSTNIAGGANGNYAENDLINIIKFIYNVPTDTLTFSVSGAPIEISDFDYMAVRYHWLAGAGSDLDIKVGYENNNTPQVDNQYVGFGQGHITVPSPIDPLSDAYLWWGADNTSSAGIEAVLIGIEKFIAAYPNSPNIVEIGLYSVWYGAPITGGFSVELVTYKGGTMSIVGNNFVNTGGIQMPSNIVEVVNKTHVPDQHYKVGTVRYNKTTRTASIVIN